MNDILVRTKDRDMENIEFIKQYFRDFQGVELQNATTIKRALEELRLRVEKEYKDATHWKMSNKYDCNNLYVDIQFKDEFLVGFVLSSHNRTTTVFYIIEELIERIKNCRYKKEYDITIRKYMTMLNADEIETMEELEEMEEEDFDDGNTNGKITIKIDKGTFQYVNNDTIYDVEDLVEMFGDDYENHFIELDYDLYDEFTFDNIGKIIKDIKFIKAGYKWDNVYYGVIN